MVSSYVPGKNAIPLWPEGSSELDGVPETDIPTLTPFLLIGDEPTAVVVVCPGGGYHMKADHEGDPVAHWLNTLGISAVVVDYRVAPHTHPAPWHDAQRAIRMVRANASHWGVRTDQVGILGFSAGGHLAATVGTHWDLGDAGADDPIERESSRPDVIVDCYGVISMQEIAHTGSLANLLGESPNEAQLRDLSADLNVGPETPPAFIWHTADDEVVDVEHSLRFASALGKHGVTFALHVFPHGQHGLGLAEDDPVVSTWTSLCGQFLDDQGF
ncbi:MAG: alpha/beta hydrolase [Thermomicrobiales bacterium]